VTLAGAGPAAWRQATRMLVAIGIAFALTRALHLRSGYWAMITVATVVQGNLGGTLDAGFSQFAGTVVGGLLGMGGVLLRTHHLAPDWVVLLAVLTPLAVLSASNPHLRTGPVTALIVLLVTPSAGSSIDLALGRIGEIAIGSVIGIAVSILVLPSRTAETLRRHIAAGLRALGARAYADLSGAPDDDRLDQAIHTAIADGDAAHTALMQERALRLGGAAPVDPLLPGLRRLRTDVFMLGNAAGADDPPGLGAPVRDWFDRAADSVLHGTPAPVTEAIEAVAAACPTDRPLGFALHILQRDLADMAERIEADRQGRR